MDHVGPWLTTAVARECLGVLGARTARGDPVTGGAEQAGGLAAGGRAPAAARVRPAGGAGLNATGGGSCRRAGPPPAAAAWADAGLPAVVAVAGRSSRRWSPGSASPQYQGPEERGQAPHDPELAEARREMSSSRTRTTLSRTTAAAGVMTTRPCRPPWRSGGASAARSLPVPSRTCRALTAWRPRAR